MSIENIQRRSYQVPLPSECLLHLPQDVGPLTPLVLCLHGYGMNPLDMLRLTAMAVGPSPIIASLRAPHPHYSPRPEPGATVGYHWGVSTHWEEAVRLHHSMLMALLNSLSEEFKIPAARTLLLGFSQPVGLNYRFVATHAGLVRGVIALCGGVPRDWEESKYQKIDAAILHISRDQDEFYPTERSLEFPDRLRRYASDVEFHMLPGAHRFPSKAAGVIQSWIMRVFQ
jgi:predicted esterase